MAGRTTFTINDHLDGIDPLIHAPARLRIMTQLFVLESADATYLVTQTGLTWGNLSTHLAKLDDHGYVSVEKGFQGKKPRTMIALTDKGRDAFLNYRENMKLVLESTR
jgi:DNA-binding MarR family transcriptional regulator